MASIAMRLIPHNLALTLAFVGFFAASDPALAQDTAITDAERTKIETVLKDFLAKNPAVIVESLQKYQEQERANMDRQFTDKFAGMRADILKAGHPTVGPETADVTIIEFYDYNCGYCKKAYDDVSKLVEGDKKLRFVFIEMPILSESSIEAAKWALAADKQGKFFEYHSALMKFTGQKDKNKLKEIAAEVKMDVAKAEADAESKATLETIEKNLALARDLGISGTPGFIFNDQLTPGYMGYDGMKDMIATLRGKKAPAE